MVAKKREWDESKRSKIVQSFVYSDEIKCPNDKTDLKLSYKVEYDNVVFTFSCSRCAREAEAKLDLLERRYVELATIGHGTMGQVCIGRHLRLARRVIIKQIRSDFMQRKEDDFPFRFEREVRICSSLDHPNIIKVFDRNVSKENEDNPPYFVMEYVHGGDLDSWIKRHPKPLHTKLMKFSQICEAIQFAHSKGVVHRDLKPSNILMTTKGEPKIADFGLAKFISRKELLLTSPSSLIGSFPYMAPEQYENPEKVDHRADIYSLGVLLYRILTNRLPFINPPKITTLVSGLGGDADKLFYKMTQMDREKRYQSIDEFQGDFRELFKEKQKRKG